MALDDVAGGDVLQVDIAGRYTVTVNYPFLRTVAPVDNALESPFGVGRLPGLQHGEQILHELGVLDNASGDVKRHAVTCQMLVALRIAQGLISCVGNVDLNLVGVHSGKQKAAFAVNGSMSRFSTK